MQQDYLDIQDIEKMEGWKVFQKRLLEEIHRAEHDIRNINRESRTLHEIGAEYVTLAERINGLRRALEIPEEIKRDSSRQ